MAWVIDLDGVVWRGSDPVEGAVAALGRLLDAGEQVAFVTNNSSVPAHEVRRRLTELGVPGGPEVLTSADAAATVVEAGERVLVRGGPGLVDALSARGAELVDRRPADTVVVGWHRDFTYDSLAEAHLAVAAGARFVATNDDATYPTGEVEIPGSGALVAYLARSTGVDPVIAGKPHGPMAELITTRLGADGWVVGDRVETDGLLAGRLGWRFALVLTGVTDPRGAGGSAADLVARDLTEVVDELAR